MTERIDIKSPVRILCAAVYIDTGKAEPRRRSYSYPATGLVFAGWRHGDCVMLAQAWWERLWPWQRWRIQRINEGHPYSRQGFLTSAGEYVDRTEAQRIAITAGQVNLDTLRGDNLYSEDLY